jgi:Domain of unknown function (DUF4129)
MGGRRLFLLGLGVTGLLVLAGIASNGRPLSGGADGNGPSTLFFDYVYTTLALVGLATFLFCLYAVLTMRLSTVQARPSHWRVWSTLLASVLFLGLGLVIMRSEFGERLREAFRQNANRAQTGPQSGQPVNPNGRNARIRWEEVALIVVTIAGIAVVLRATRSARRLPRPWRTHSQEAVAAALDESLDDLLAEPDLRKAIIAAYARMERALAAGGLPRRPSEAPFEYVERALRELDASADAAQRLTALFEWAKFSQHDPEPAMRDEAIAALVAVRDELRAPAEAAA